MKNLVCGKNPVKEVFLAGKSIHKIYVIKTRRSAADATFLQQARRQGIPVREVDRTQMLALVGHEGHQGIAAVLAESGYRDMADIFQLAGEKNEPPLIAILDEIQDPHNLGAIIRSAEAFGFHGVVIPKDRSAGLSDTVAKTSAGALAHIPIVRVTNLARTLEELKEKGVWIAGAEQTAETDFYDSNFSGALAVVVGSEGRGLRRLIKENCDFLIKIPMYGKINSLNASVAAALLFAEARKQRQLLK